MKFVVCSGPTSVATVGQACVRGDGSPAGRLIMKFAVCSGSTSVATVGRGPASEVMTQLQEVPS